MNHIVQVARAKPLRQRPQLLREHFFENVGCHLDARDRAVTVGVMDGSPDSRKHDTLVIRQIELDTRGITTAGNGTAIAHAPLRRPTTPAVIEDFDATRIGRQLHTCLLVDPICEFLKERPKKHLIQMRGVTQGEIQIFRKSVGFEVAFLETGSALEQP
jgi:hypothetical protein